MAVLDDGSNTLITKPEGKDIIGICYQIMGSNVPSVEGVSAVSIIEWVDAEKITYENRNQKQRVYDTVIFCLLEAFTTYLQCM